MTAFGEDLVEILSSISVDLKDLSGAHTSEIGAILATATTTPSREQLSSIEDVAKQFLTTTADVTAFYSSLNALASPFSIAAAESAYLSELADGKSFFSGEIADAVATDFGQSALTRTGAATTMQTSAASAASGSSTSTSSSSSGGAMPAVTAGPRMVVSAAAATMGIVGVALL